MGRYVGEIQVKESGGNGFYVNFYPGYEIIGNSFIYLTEEDIYQLFPDTSMPNLNLFSSSSSMKLDELFIDGDDVVLDFSYEDLQPNLNGAGLRYPTAWKLDISRKGGNMMMHMEDLGYYYAVEKGVVEGNWKTDSIMYINSPNVNENMQIMVPDEQDPEVLYGPFHVRFDEDKGLPYFNTHMARNKYVLRGYRYSGGLRAYTRVLEQFDVTRSYVRISGEGIEAVYRDEISEEKLLEDFKEVVARRGYKQHKLDLSNISTVLSHYETSLMTGVSIPREIAAERMKTLRSIFDAEKNYDQTLQSVASLAGRFIEGFGTDEVWQSFVHKLASDEDFLTSLSAFDEYRAKTEGWQKEIDRLSGQKDALEEKVLELEHLNPDEKIAQFNRELERLETARTHAEEKLEVSLGRLHIGEKIEDLENRAAWLESEIGQREAKAAMLEKQIQMLNGSMDEILSQSAKRAMEISFDSLLSSRMMAQAARLEREQEIEKYVSTAKAIRALPGSYLQGEDLVNYLVSTIRRVRPDYSRNMVLNVLICLSQGFLTIFSGDPGTGKSSLCKIVAEVLGMNESARQLKNESGLASTKRFVQVSVERGWNSRRDLVGFYNALTQSFDKANAAVFDLLCILDQETRSSLNQTDLPALILLDDANLSSMEYYWADFMSLQDGEPVRGEINLGEEYALSVPETLHFAATINTDHTTEPLSRRLLDRAWVVRMPDVRVSRYQPLSLWDVRPELISYTALQGVFGPDASDSFHFSSTAQTLFDQAAALFKEAGIPVSTRAEFAVRNYVSAAARWFEEDPASGLSADISALDYAIAQRILPQISGSSQKYRRGLEKLEAFFSRHKMSQCSAIIHEILVQGDESMQYYQYFA